MSKLFILVFLVVLSSCSKQEEKSRVKKVVTYAELEKELANKDDKLLVVNFWATWCKPCVEELPHFMEINQEYKARTDYEMILVSLDKAASLNNEMTELANKLNLTTDLYLLSDNANMNIWIPAIDSSWSGAIPATVFYKNGEKVNFTEGQLTKNELNEKINQYL